MASRRTPDSTPSSPTTKQSSPTTKPAAKKAAAKPAPVTTPPVAATEVSEPAKAAPAKGATAPKSKASRTVAPTRPVVTPEMRRGMIAEAAYLRAERRGFAQGSEEEDWLAAEAEVDKLLSADSRAPQ